MVNKTQHEFRIIINRFIKFAAVAIMLLTLGAGVFIAMFFLDSTQSGSKEGTALNLSGPNDIETEAGQGGSGSRADMEFNVSDVPKDGLPSEKAFSDDLHHMSHQKVKADRKWGHLEITDERISEMIDTAEESSYEYRDFYIETLEAWQNDHFANAVEVHNTIWNANNGTVGKAYGLMSESEESEYIERHFE